jgi:hypothetical protein
MIRFSTDPYIAESQMRALIQHLVAFGYIDADFDPAERRFIRDHIAKLVEQRARDLGGADVSREIVEKWTRHFHEVLDEIDQRIQSLFAEPVSSGETTEQYVLSRLKLGCFELLKRFDEEGQQEILAAVEELIHADGVVHPNEVLFRDELKRLITSTVELDESEIQPAAEGDLIIAEVMRPQGPLDDHEFLRRQEWDFSRDPVTFDHQSVRDMDLARHVMDLLDQQRSAGQGRLAALRSLAACVPGTRFLDGHVGVLAPLPTQEYELLVLGDLHGCYSCLKAALLQADFLGKAQAHLDDPKRHHPIYLVCLGDYIDRGRFGLSGTLRTVMQLFLKLPELVFPLRGNHEYYVELDGRVLAPVRPCEAMDSIAGVAKNEVLSTYMRLFESLPTLLAFGDILFVHGGIPRSDTLQERWTGLASLEDPELRFEMLWGDPSEADAVPRELQRASARFSFGRRQFQSFMARVGCSVMVRGHERIVEGFQSVYGDGPCKLLTLFSAGGAENDDLPRDSNYREVRPMALTIRRRAGVSTITPFEIDYARYNDPRYNAFFEDKLNR